MRYKPITSFSWKLVTVLGAFSSRLNGLRVKVQDSTQAALKNPALYMGCRINESKGFLAFFERNRATILSPYPSRHLSGESGESSRLSVW
jgi:hypothetical protein